MWIIWQFQRTRYKIRFAVLSAKPRSFRAYNRMCAKCKSRSAAVWSFAGPVVQVNKLASVKAQHGRTEQIRIQRRPPSFVSVLFAVPGQDGRPPGRAVCHQQQIALSHTYTRPINTLSHTHTHTKYLYAIESI